MRILYVAKHNSGGNDDEGAIAYALTYLGHEVYCLPEQPKRERFDWPPADFCLFHKWMDIEALVQLAKRMPLVCWYFDLVNYPDETLIARNQQRRRYMTDVANLTEHIFCTDGDWAHANGLQHLPQGADERLVDLGSAYPDMPILVAASRKGGIARDAFFTEMERYGPKLRHVQRGLHGIHLRDVIAESHVVVAPSAPVTDRYWSNRVYLTLGFGGILLHPFSKGLGEHFVHGRDLVYYGDCRDMHAKIEYLLSCNEEQRIRMRLAALDVIRREHLYRHRCIELICTLRECL